MNNKMLNQGTHPQDARLHKIVYVLVVICMFGLAIEGTFIIPFVSVWYGWPDLSMQQMCNELSKTAYQDPSRKCLYPYPLLSGSEPRRYPPYTADLIGKYSPVMPMPDYSRIGFRELIKIREARLQHQHDAKLSDRAAVH